MLITGDTGSGKTRSGITPLLHQVFTNELTWGGLCIDDKGLYWETLSAMAKHFGRGNDLILLQVRPEGAAVDWKPRHTYNLTSDITIPFNTFAKAVVDTASSLGQSGDKGFFRHQAQTHIATALEVLRLIGADATLENTYHLLLDERDLEDALTVLANAAAPTPSPRTHRPLPQPLPFTTTRATRRRARDHRELLAGIHHPDIAQVFCPGANTFDFADMDHG